MNIKLLGLVTITFWLLGCGQATSNSGYDPQSKLQELTNLETLSKKARDQNLPIMLMAGAEWCEFCHILRSEVLDPMALGGDYDGKVVFMRYLSVDEHQPIADVNGEPIRKDQLARRYRADLTPTVIFINGQGEKVADNIVGIANIELYTTLIHKHLNDAYQKMGNPLRLEAMPSQ
ncbi:MAG: thioredoxin family protein [Hydrogenovibrio sp.]